MTDNPGSSRLDQSADGCEKEKSKVIVQTPLLEGMGASLNTYKDFDQTIALQILSTIPDLQLKSVVKDDSNVF